MCGNSLENLVLDSYVSHNFLTLETVTITYCEEVLWKNKLTKLCFKFLNISLNKTDLFKKLTKLKLLLRELAVNIWNVYYNIM